MRKIDTIIIHCADTPPTMDIGRAEINQWHLQRGFACIGYHAVIRRNGTIEVGRQLDAAGAHCRGHNSTSIGVCLVGGAKGKADYTDAQWCALKGFVSQLTRQFPGAIVKGHCDFDKGKTCPNFDASAWWSSVQEPAV